MKLTAGEYKLVIDEDGAQYTYNANGKEIHYKNSNGYESWNEYDDYGNKIHWKDSNGDEAWYEYDANGNMIHFKDSNGLEAWWEYDTNGNMIHYKDTTGYEQWYDTNGKKITKAEYDALQAPCHGKVVDIDGKKYKLSAL